MNSVIHDGRKCYLCGMDYETLDWHHIFFGPNRKHSEKYGLKVRLCHSKCHIFGERAAHNCKETDLKLKKIGQKKFEETHSREEFMQIFGRNYILTEEKEELLW